ncbi:MAG: carboxypeptidase-like regulatory domain-containing protein [Oscillospiraceae bacterium]|nr:carboxypeptidase-like regulatory domain-containing protein [Oscillospiraceae bacterium]
MSAYAKFFFRPGVNERIETQVELAPETRSAIHGVIRGVDGLPVSDAVVMLFETGKTPDELQHITQMISDENGRFVFGPLTAGTLYMIKIFKNAVKLRELEVLARIPGDCN